MERLFEALLIFPAVMLTFVLVPCIVVWVLIKLAELLGYVGPTIARITHFVFMVIPAIILAAIIAYPEDMFFYLSALAFWIPFYVLTRKEN